MGGTFQFVLKTKDLPIMEKVITKYGIDKNGPVQQFVDSECLRRMDPFIPFDTGALRDDGVMNTRIGSGEIVYYSLYSRKQYYIPMHHHGIRTAYWFEHMLNGGGREKILKGAQKIAEQMGDH